MRQSGSTKAEEKSEEKYVRWFVHIMCPNRKAKIADETQVVDGQRGGAGALQVGWIVWSNNKALIADDASSKINLTFFSSFFLKE